MSFVRRIWTFPFRRRPITTNNFCNKRPKRWCRKSFPMRSNKRWLNNTTKRWKKKRRVWCKTSSTMSWTFDTEQITDWSSLVKDVPEELIEPKSSDEDEEEEGQNLPISSHSAQELTDLLNELQNLEEKIEDERAPGLNRRNAINRRTTATKNRRNSSSDAARSAVSFRVRCRHVEINARIGRSRPRTALARTRNHPFDVNRIDFVGLGKRRNSSLRSERTDADDQHDPRRTN